VSVTSEYLEYVRDLLEGVPELRSRHMFGGVGLYSGERFFAILADDTLYLKADDASRPLFRDGAAEAFGYLRRDKTCALDYWSVPARVLEEPELLRQWGTAALDAALRGKR